VRRRAVVRTAAMTGLARGAVLHRTVDGDGHAYTLPPTGAVLSASFARQLGVARGDTIYVELLERGDAVRAVVATGFVDELVGANIYMERAALDGLVGDGERITGAYLRVDPRAGDAVLARLKRFPAISGASSRQSLIDAFDRQMAESVRISGSIVVAFAIVIALSVVYNGARIALSERGRELASLRVLGFSRREVAAMLFGEQGALVAVAIPLGVLAGLALTTIIGRAFEAEDHHFPFVVETRTYVGAIGIVILAGVLASLAMRRRLNRMDLVAVLKTRE
jgi:putative ABC transport system permease protein